MVDARFGGVGVMAGVMEGRRFRFAIEPYRRDSYVVMASLPPGSVMTDEPVNIGLGHVLRERRSTDSRIAGTRLRREGKGAVEWSAEVPREQGERCSGALARLLVERGAMPGRRRWELEPYRGQRWERREDAALALAAWYDQRAAA